MSEALSPHVLTGAPIASIARAGHAPLEGDDPIEIMLANGEMLTIEIGIEAATDIRIYRGALLDVAFGHLRNEEPATFAGIARDWTREDMRDMAWLIGKTLMNPRRLAMTNPYRVEVGYVFDAGGRELVLMGEADFIWAAPLDDAELESFGLEIGAAA